MKILSRVCLLAILAVFVSAGSAEADTFYRETFNFCELTSSRPSASGVAGWEVITTGHTIGKPSVLKIQPTGAATGFPAVNSVPEGPEDGNAFWTRATKGALFYTSEISFDISEVTAVTWRQRIDRSEKAFPQYGARLAFLIGAQWYISDFSSVQRTRGVFERAELAPHSLTYGTTPYSGAIGPVAPVNSGLLLPANGTVTAFGLFFQRAYGKIRLDDFALVNAQPSGTNSADTTYERCSLIVQNDAPIPTTQSPSLTTPGAAGYCAGDATPTLLQISSRNRSKLLAKVRGKSLQNYRDRLLVSLASSGVPFNAITNIVSGDLVKYKRNYYLVLSSGQNLRISSTLASDLNKYIAKAGLTGSLDPVFKQLSADGKSVTSAPICVSYLTAIVQWYVDRAKLGTKVAFV